jgi:hypothetical protein
MSDPRARITNARRELTTKPHTAAADVVAVVMPPPASIGSTTVPGKRHGRKRSIGLHLPGLTCDAIRRAAEHDGTTLADIVLIAIERCSPPGSVAFERTSIGHKRCSSCLHPLRPRRSHRSPNRPGPLCLPWSRKRSKSPLWPNRNTRVSQHVFSELGRGRSRTGSSRLTQQSHRWCSCPCLRKRGIAPRGLHQTGLRTSCRARPQIRSART